MKKRWGRVKEQVPIRQEDHLLLEELGCPHRWGYGIGKNGKPLGMYCMDCRKRPYLDQVRRTTSPGAR
jgi:hypothetical protein